jgi:2-haloacid dehalogenase
VILPRLEKETILGIPKIEALTFDVFGTVVDWRSSVVRDLRKLSESHGFTVDTQQFALEWRAGYLPAMDRVRTGELPWTKIDELHRMILETLLEKYSLGGLGENEKEDLNHVWHRLDPWPDAVEGLTRLKRRYIIATLSNGNLSLLTHMAKYAGLPWDCILSAELALRYKPDCKVYLKAAELLSLPPHKVMMVASHVEDLAAARSVGFRSAFVPRPLEYGKREEKDFPTDPDADIVAEDFLDLADRLLD